MERQETQSVFLLLIYFLVTFGYIFSLGFYHLPGLILLVIAFFLLSLFYFLPKITTQLQIKNAEQIFIFSAIISIALSLVIYGGMYQEKVALFYFSLFLLSIALLLSLTYFFQPPNNLPIQPASYPQPQLQTSNSHSLVLNLQILILKNRFWIFVGLAFLLRLSMIISSPSPTIDVFDTLKNAPKFLLAGQNPYSANYTPLYKDVPADYFAYPPGILLLATPFVWFLNDPRYLFLLAEITLGILIYYFLKKKTPLVAEALPLLLLFNPRALFVLEQSWIDVASILLILMTYLTISQEKLKNLGFLLLGALLTIKQTLVFIPFFVIKNITFSRKNAAIFVLPLLLVITPFLIWSPHDFFEDLILAYLNFPPARLELLRSSLSLPSFLYQEFKIEVSSFLSLFLSGIFLIVTLIFQKRLWQNFFVGIALFFLAFHLLNRIAFTDHYYFVGQLLLLAIFTDLRYQEISI